MGKILITGSTGNIGTRLVRTLSAAGHSVRAMARSKEKARFDDSVEVVTGDFKDRRSLREALDGVSRVYLVSAATDLEEHDANAIDEARAAGVELVVKQSVIRAPHKESDIPRWHRAGEERLEASGLPYVFLRPASFASNSLGWLATIKSEGTAYGALGDAALPVIHPDDIADTAAAVLTNDGHAGKAYDLTGPEALTSAQQVEILGAAIGRPLKYVNVADDAVRQGMLKAGTPEVYVNARLGLVQLLRNAGRIEPTRSVESITGRPARPFREWAEANAAAFQ